VRFAFIATEKACFPVALMCRLLAVSRAGFYAWRQRPVAQRTRQDETLTAVVAAIYAENHGRYGSPRVQMELRARSQRSGRKRIARLMRVQGLRARPRRRYRTTTDSRHGLPAAPNLLARRFAVAEPQQGSQYTSLAFGQRCEAAGVRPSMGSVGDCFDNAMCESFFATLECELLNRRSFKSQIEASLAIFEFIEGWYNPHRRHSAINYLSPIDFERNYRDNTDYRSPPPSTEAG
jgi:putative transposase